MYDNTYLRNNTALEHILYDSSFKVEKLIMPYCVSEHSVTPKNSIPYGIQVVTPELVYVDLKKYVPRGLKGILLTTCKVKEHIHDPFILDECEYMLEMVRCIKQYYPHIVVMVDISTCMCNADYYFGLQRSGVLHIDATIDKLTEIAVSFARAGVDVIVHSGLLLNLTQSIKRTLQSHSIYHVAVMAYAMQDRDIFCGTLLQSRRISTPIYTSREQYIAVAEREVRSGVDILAVSPLMSSFDAITTITNIAHLPIFGVHTNKEYAMLRCAVESNIFFEEEALHTFYMAALRAGVTAVISPYTCALLK